MMEIHKSIRYLFACLVTFFLAGCGPAVATTATPGMPTVAPPSPPAQTATAAPAAGVRKFDDFVSALRSAGASVETAGEIEQPFFSVTGQRVLVNGSEVQVFEFADESARASVSATISETGDQIGTSLPAWIEQPNFWAGGNLIVLYVGSTPSVIDLLTGVMGGPITRAGPSASQTPQAVLGAQRWLAEQFGAQVEQIEVVSIEHVDWPDSCLGLGQPNESCAQVITPGWRVVLRVDGQEHEVRTDETASVVRLTPPAGGDSLPGTQWTLASSGEPGSETPVIEGSAITLDFGADGQVSGSGGCNSYSGQYKIQDGALSIGEVISTKRACAEAGLTRQEQQYFQALETAGAFERSGDQLTVSFDGGQGVLNFVEAAASNAAEARVPGIVEFQNEGAQDVLTAPETVKAGETFEVTISTFGGGCEREGDTAVILSPSTAAVMVYDFTTATHPDVVCAAILKRLTHTLTLSFAEPGEAVIQVWGRRVGPDTPPVGEPALLEHRIRVES